MGNKINEIRFIEINSFALMIILSSKIFFRIDAHRLKNKIKKKNFIQFFLNSEPKKIP